MKWADLAASVPAAVRVAAEWPVERRIKEADRCADVIASGGDVLRGRGKSPGRAEVTRDQVTEAVITGLGILACRPGGSGFGGMHWHASQAQCMACPGPGTLPLFDLPDPGEAIGAVFTPRLIADEVVANTLAVITEPRSMCPAGDIEMLRVVDPFCGTGAFLVAAARYLGDALAAAWDRRDQAEIRNLCALYGTSNPLMAARALVITHCVFGVDRDPMSVELAGLALQLLAPECPTGHVLNVDDGDYVHYVASEPDAGQVPGHARLIRPAGPPTGRLAGLRAGDSLVGRLRGLPPSFRPASVACLNWPDVFADVFDYGGGFDAVIGNPPFLGGNMIEGACGALYREYLIDAIAGGKRATVDLAVYCWLRAHQLVHGNGVVGIVGPDSMLRGRNAKLAFGLLERDGWLPYRGAGDLPWPSGNAAVRICTIWTYRWGGADIPESVRTVPQGAPPPHLWKLSREIDVDGEPVRVYTPIPQSPASKPRARPRTDAARQPARAGAAA